VDRSRPFLDGTGQRQSRWSGLRLKSRDHVDEPDQRLRVVVGDDLRHELPYTDRSSDVFAFATAATVYGVLLLSLSQSG
jgi:hypothetical protein